MLDLVNVFLRHRWKIAGMSFAAALVLATLTVAGPTTFTSQASFMPQLDSGRGGELSQLSGVASQFGIDVPTGGAGASPEFYRILITSHRILESTVRSHYQVVRDGDTVDAELPDFLDLGAPTENLADERAIRWLGNRISTNTVPETGIVEFSVTTGSPKLSKQIADRLIELLNQFNLQVRQSQASAQAEFVNERLEVARKELRAAEDSLERFLQRNRSFQNSPTLRFEHQRLQRRVDLKQQVYTSLATRYEEAQISEVRNTPVITVVSPPTLPGTADPTRLPLKVLLGLLLGGMLGSFWAFGSELNRKARRETGEAYQEFEELRAAVVQDLRELVRRLARLLRLSETR